VLPVFRPYRDALLSPGERIVLITRPHPFTFWAGAIRGVIVAIAALAAALAVEQWHVLPAATVRAQSPITAVLLLVVLLSLVSALVAWLRWRMHEIVVTDRRVIRISGILSKEVIDYSLDAITDLRLRQSWLGRIFGYGDVEILTASEVTSRPRDTFPVVAGPIEFTHAVQEQRERRRTRATGVVDLDPRLTDTHPIPIVEPR
jgi:uncharacterized membrane protein YdbT with pleckstrin-like domain